MCQLFHILALSTHSKYVTSLFLYSKNLNNILKLRNFNIKGPISITNKNKESKTAIKFNV